MGVYSLIFRSNVPPNVRLQAFTNVVCAVYMAMMTLGVTHICFFYIVPECHYGDQSAIFKHRLAIWYLFTSTVGHYFTCIFTDTSANRKYRGTTVTNGTNHSQNGTGGSGTLQATAINSTKPKLKFCPKCCLYVPPRSHHCYLCGQCILKRDHHCFFMGVCIGRENHIYFIFFTMAMGCGTFYGLLLVAKYMYFLYGIQFQGPQTFITLFYSTFTDLLSGKVPSIRYLALFVFLYVSLAGTMVAFGFFGWQMLIVLNGQTTYEARNGTRKFSKGSYLYNFRCVFNRRSIVSLLLPFYDLATSTNYCRITEEVTVRKTSGKTTDVKTKQNGGRANLVRRRHASKIPSVK